MSHIAGQVDGFIRQQAPPAFQRIGVALQMTNAAPT
jgi:hypothetical protein